jgi:hypothetical protein
MDARPKQNDTCVFLRGTGNREVPGERAGRKNAAGVDARGIVPADLSFVLSLLLLSRSLGYG